jgi:hypothetical protein
VGKGPNQRGATGSRWRGCREYRTRSDKSEDQEGGGGRCSKASSKYFIETILS